MKNKILFYLGGVVLLAVAGYFVWDVVIVDAEVNNLAPLNQSALSLEFKKIILDNSKNYKYQSDISIFDLQKYSYGGNKYLIVLQDNDKERKAILSVWDLKDPLNPLLKKDNIFSRSEIFGNEENPRFPEIKYLRLIDDYPYFIGGSIGVDMSVFKFDVSGTITKVETLPRLKWTTSEGQKYDGHQNVVGMFKSGDKVYVARNGYGAKGFDQDEGCQALIQNKNDSLTSPNYVYFFDVTNGMDGGLPASSCVGGWKLPGYFNEASQAHVTYISDSQDMFFVSNSGKNYIGFTEYSEVHHYHNHIDLMTLLDVTDINNIKPITKGLSGTQLFSDIFSYSNDLNELEGRLVGVNGVAPYGLGKSIVSSYQKTVVDKTLGLLIHGYSYVMPDYTGQGIGITVKESILNGIYRMRSYILASDLNLNVKSNTKQILCEQSGEMPSFGSMCGRTRERGDKYPVVFNTTNFLETPNSLLASDNGVVVSETGRFGYVSSKGFEYLDGSSEVDKFFNLIENKNITNKIRKEGTFIEGQCNFGFENFCGFDFAVVEGIDQKTSAVYLASPFHIEVVKVSGSGGNALPPTVRPHLIITKEVTSSPFTLKNLLNIFKRINNKID